MSAKYYSEFKCPVPKGFSDVLSRCRFEQGDVFHSHMDAYEKSWGEALKKLEWSIQVKAPEKSVGESNTHGSDDIFLRNWNMSLEAEITFYRSNQNKVVKSFQGNLYDVLSTGNIDLLFEIVPSDRPLPCNQFSSNLKSLNIPKKQESQFRMVYNDPFPILRGKKSKLEKEFGSNVSVTLVPLTNLDFSRNLKVQPTCSFAVFDINTSKTEAEERIKKALYVPSTNKKVQKSKFRMSQHGLLL
jgi:hypothetical protein